VQGLSAARSHFFASDLLGERRDRDGADAADAERIAVGRGVRHGLRPDDAAGTGTVVDDDRLAQGLLDVTRGQPTEQIGVAAGRVRHDERDAPARPRLLRLHHARRQRDRERQRQSCNMLHRILLVHLGDREASSLPSVEFTRFQRLSQRRRAPADRRADELSSACNVHSRARTIGNVLIRPHAALALCI